MTAAPTNAPEAMIERIEGRLATARAALEAGEPSDLSTLEEEVARLRDAAAALPEGSGERLRPRLLALLDEIERLSAHYRDGLDRLGRELGESGRRRQAVSAYSQGPTNKPGGR